MRKEIKNLLMQSKADLRTAENSLNSEDYYASVFWCQQAIEKSLKGYIILKNKETPLHIHSLIKLGKLAKIPKKYESILKDISPEYYLTRYPDVSEDVPYELYDKNDAQTKLKNAKEILKWINAQIKE
jgi:HEPN domain-containing protein